MEFDSYSEFMCESTTLAAYKAYEEGCLTEERFQFIAGFTSTLACMNWNWFGDLCAVFSTGCFFLHPLRLLPAQVKSLLGDDTDLNKIRENINVLSAIEDVGNSHYKYWKLAKESSDFKELERLKESAFYGMLARLRYLDNHR